MKQRTMDNEHVCLSEKYVDQIVPNDENVYKTIKRQHIAKND